MQTCQVSQSRCGEVAVTPEGLLQNKGDFHLPRSQWASHHDLHSIQAQRSLIKCKGNRLGDRLIMKHTAAGLEVAWAILQGLMQQTLLAERDSVQSRERQNT